MTDIKIPRAVCAVVGDVLSSTGSHKTLDTLFIASGAPGEPPDLSHALKWNHWLFRTGSDPTTDSLSVLGNVLEEFMDLGPGKGAEDYEEWQQKHTRVTEVLEKYGFRYFQGGRILLNGEPAGGEVREATNAARKIPSKPKDIDELLYILIKGLRRAMHPLTHRRKGMQSLSFSTEYDVQDLLHALLRPWVVDIRPEEFTPSYASSSTRMDFLLPAHGVAIEIKFVRDRNHAKKIGNELIIDIEHYQRHPNCNTLWCVIYDQDSLLTNAEGLKCDLEGERKTSDSFLMTRMLIL